MPTCLQYGQANVIQFDVPEASILLNRSGPQGEPLDDPAAAVAAGFASPIEFPPLQRSVTTDDRVALALAPGVPCADAIVAGTVYALTEAGIDASQITIVQDASEACFAERDVTAGLPYELRQQVQVVAHDPTDRERLAYLNANNRDEAVYFQRDISEADLVIPISCLRGDSVLGQFGMNAELHPTFGDEAAQQRFRSVDSFHNQANRAKRVEEAEEATWLLGVMLCVGVLPADGGGVLEVLVGERRAVASRAQQLCEQAWGFDVDQRSDLVIATIAGGVEQQTWENVGRALMAASRAVNEEGAIVVCCDVKQTPTHTMQRVAAVGTSAEARKEIRRDSFSDTLAADQLTRLSESHSIYFRSGLDPEVVESLGMAHVSCDEDIVRLSSRHGTCTLIGNAQFAMPRSDN